MVTCEVVELADPVCWNPSSFLDYAAALLMSLSWVRTGVAFILWWRTSPIRRGSGLLLVAGIGTALSGVGNLPEDVRDLDFGELLFTCGE